MSDVTLNILDIRRALAEVADDLKAGRLQEFDMHGMSTCILAYASEKLGLKRVAIFDWRKYGISDEDNENLNRLGFKYVTVIGSLLDFEKFRNWRARRAIARYLAGKKRYWL